MEAMYCFTNLASSFATVVRQAGQARPGQAGRQAGRQMKIPVMATFFETYPNASKCYAVMMLNGVRL